MPNFKSSVTSRCGLALLLALVSGCAPFGWIGKKGSEEPEPQVPARMTAMWTDTVLHQPGQPGVRGFGGRVMFYAASHADSAAVDGRLIVYAFDDTGRDPTSNLSDSPMPLRSKPVRKYVFPAEHLAEHYSESQLGHSYSFWLPWDEVGGPQRHLSLIARFEGTSGAVVMADPSRHILPGTVTQSHAVARHAQGARRGDPGARDYDAKQASHQMPDGRQADSARMQTTTITLPSSFGKTAVLAENHKSGAASSTVNRQPLRATVAPSPSASRMPGGEGSGQVIDRWSRYRRAPGYGAARLSAPSRSSSRFERGRPPAQN